MKQKLLYTAMCSVTDYGDESNNRINEPMYKYDDKVGRVIAAFKCYLDLDDFVKCELMGLVCFFFSIKKDCKVTKVDKRSSRLDPYIFKTELTYLSKDDNTMKTVDICIREQAVMLK